MAALLLYPLAVIEAAPRLIAHTIRTLARTIR
jgi:hypothetical protein